ncbi:unnamed protein product [Bemisia tabaci]|uniref:NHR domain-containing protein n=1 Tax=Bemisia tabaci TaxID=7038 RepID=A0A9P0ADL3_BEMTA|nr:unnamed protein product [Bemisia tabaci]
MFHTKCGEKVILSNNNRTASRNNSEFNHGVVFSSTPLVENQLFRVRIDKKTNSCRGSVIIGVTGAISELTSVPANAIDLQRNTWILWDSFIFHNGDCVSDSYTGDLNDVNEGDLVGVMVTSTRDLVFYINGVPQGIAASNLPLGLYAVVDLFTKAAQITALPVSNYWVEEFDLDREFLESPVDELMTPVTATNDLVTNLDIKMTIPQSSSLNQLTRQRANDRLRFHSKTGSLVKLSFNKRTAERLRPFDDFNNGVVMTHRPLENDELFEIRIDKLVDKWSGSIEVGVTTHFPHALDFPATMTNLRSGTIMMSGCGILTNGKGTRREYGEFNLDDLRIGDRIAMMRKSDGTLHYFINGLDQGVAARIVPPYCYGVVDLYGRTVKVTIVDRDEREEQNLITRRNTALMDQQPGQSSNDFPEEDNADRLMLHSVCGAHASVISNNRTALRPNALEDFNDAVVLTHRPLKPDELFEVQLDKMVTKWAGTIEIGVTTHSPEDLEYPSTMTNVKSGTWMMTGNGVMRNGVTIIDDYGPNLDQLQVGDRVGVIVKENGALHFFVNGVDLGEAATNIPVGKVYGVIDLYGQAAQATIVDYNLLCCCSSPAQSSPNVFGEHVDLHFHYLHGKNARVSNGGRTASRPKALHEFNEAIVISNRTLKENEMFAVVIEKLVDRWCGSIEAGVTAIRPDELELPGTMTDLDHDTWMLSGATVMQDGVMFRHSYKLNLDSLSVGDVIGMMRHPDTSLHFYLNGIDQGAACFSVPQNVYPVIDLYGQCAQVSIVSLPEGRQDADCNDADTSSPSVASQIGDTFTPILREPEVKKKTHIPSHLTHRLSALCSQHIQLDVNNTVATRISLGNYGLVFSSCPVMKDQVFTIQIDQCDTALAGSLAIGITTMQPAEKTALPSTIHQLKQPVWFLKGSDIWYNNTILRERYCQSLDWAESGTLVSLKLCSNQTLRFYIDNIDCGVAVQNIPKALFYAIVDLSGRTLSVSVISQSTDVFLMRLASSKAQMADSLKSDESSSCQSGPVVEVTVADIPTRGGTEECSFANKLESDIKKIFSDDCWFSFKEITGQNIVLINDGITIKRETSYNNGVVVCSKPLPRCTLFQMVLESLNPRWVSSIMLGVVNEPQFPVPPTALGFKKNAWIISADSVFQDGEKIKSNYGPNLDKLSVKQTVGVMVDAESQLRLFVNGVDQGVAATNIPYKCHVVIDLYGQCDQISIINSPLHFSQMSAPVETKIEEPESVPEELKPVDVCEKADLESHEKEQCDENSDQELCCDDPALSKSVKTNENCLVASASSLTLKTENSDDELDPKSIASNENLSLQHLEQVQNATLSWLSASHCDKKTSLNIANTSFAEAGKSSGKSTATTPVTCGKSVNVTRSFDDGSPVMSPAAETPLKPLSNCDYLKLCLRLKATLCLPSFYFQSDTAAVCFCSDCSPSYNSLKEEPPPGTVPSNWCKLPLHKLTSPSTVEKLSCDKWHIAYASASLGQIRQVLEQGELFDPCENLGSCDTHSEFKWKQNECDASQIILSPTLKHVASPLISKKHEFCDPKTKKLYLAHAAFQVLVKPGSYKTNPLPDTGLSKSIDSLSDTDSVQWQTKEQGATLLTALLLKLDPI